MQAFDEADAARLRAALTMVVRELDRRSTEGNVTGAQLRVLGVIVSRKRVGLTELAEFEGINPTMLSRVIGKLEAAELVKRVADDNDRRVFHAESTPAGVRLWERNRRTRTRLLAQLLDKLPEPDTAALLQALPALEALVAVVKTRPAGLSRPASAAKQLAKAGRP
jgi:DNA-binding MarR family transcriptional regulator